MAARPPTFVQYLTAAGVKYYYEPISKQTTYTFPAHAIIIDPKTKQILYTPPGLVVKMAPNASPQNLPPGTAFPGNSPNISNIPNQAQRGPVQQPNLAAVNPNSQLQQNQMMNNNYYYQQQQQNRVINNVNSQQPNQVNGSYPNTANNNATTMNNTNNTINTNNANNNIYNNNNNNINNNANSNINNNANMNRMGNATNVNNVNNVNNVSNVRPQAINAPPSNVGFNQNSPIFQHASAVIADRKRLATPGAQLSLESIPTLPENVFPTRLSSSNSHSPQSEFSIINNNNSNTNNNSNSTGNLFGITENFIIPDILVLAENALAVDSDNPFDYPEGSFFGQNDNLLDSGLINNSIFSSSILSGTATTGTSPNGQQQPSSSSAEGQTSTGSPDETSTSTSKGDSNAQSSSNKNPAGGHSNDDSDEDSQSKSKSSTNSASGVSVSTSNTSSGGASGRSALPKPLDSDSIKVIFLIIELIANSFKVDASKFMTRGDLISFTNQYKIDDYINENFKQGSSGSNKKQSAGNVNYMFSFSDKPLQKPLHKKIRKEHKQFAVTISASILQFMGVISGHNQIIVARNICNILQIHPELVEEAFFQVMKQTTSCPNPKWTENGFLLFVIISTLFRPRKKPKPYIMCWAVRHLLDPSWKLRDFFSYILIKIEGRFLRGNFKNPITIDVIKEIPSHLEKATSLFDTSIFEIMWFQRKRFAKLRVPIPLVLMISELRKKNAFKTKALLDKPGNEAVTDKWKAEITSNYHVLEGGNVQDLMELFKQWLVMIIDPVVPRATFNAFVHYNNAVEFVAILPAAHKDTLKFIIGFLQEVLNPANTAVNGASLDKIATMFGPMICNPFEIVHTQEIIDALCQRGVEFIKELLGSWSTGDIYPGDFDFSDKPKARPQQQQQAQAGQGKPQQQPTQAAEPSQQPTSQTPF